MTEPTYDYADTQEVDLARPAVPAGGDLVPAELRGGRHGAYLTNIEPGPDSLWMLSAVHGQADSRGRNELGRQFDLRWFYLHMVTRTDHATGEVRDEPRLVLFAADGKSIVSSGAAVRDMLLSIVAVRGLKPFDPPVPVTINEVPLEGGKSYHILKVQRPAIKQKGK